MPDLFLHGREIHTVFELLGIAENDITFSLGWCLAESPALATALMRDALGTAPESLVDVVRLQQHDRDKGITDVELHAGRAHLIIEAKRGWTLPTTAQLSQYARRDPTPIQILALSECSSEYAAPRLTPDVGGVPVVHRSWKQLAALTRKVRPRAKLHERHLLDEFLNYLERAMPIQEKESNAVYVVSLGAGAPDHSSISWIDIVEKKDCYFHPVGENWPKVPPNYIGFRYAGRLQCIRHVDDYSIHTDPHEVLAGMESRDWGIPHFFYELGPRVVPPKEVKTGNLYMNARCWAAIDLLLTSKTVSQARDETQKRLASLEHG